MAQRVRLQLGERPDQLRLIHEGRFEDARLGGFGVTPACPAPPAPERRPLSLEGSREQAERPCVRGAGPPGAAGPGRVAARGARLARTPGRAILPGMRSLAFSLALTMAACGKGGAPGSGPAQAQPPQADRPGDVVGGAGGVTLDPRSAIFLWAAGADDMTILLSDRPDLCAVVGRGAWPREATLLRMTIKQGGDLRDAPFGGDYPIPQGERGSRWLKRAELRRLDAACAPAAGARAQAGQVRITRVQPGGPAEGSFELTMEGGEALRGSFTASACPPPDEEPRECR